MRVLITGITGFVGSHLAEYIINLNEGHEVYGLCRWRSPRENIKDIIDKVELVECDLNDMGGLVRVMEKTQPDIIHHLAAQSYVRTSFNNSIQTLLPNVIGTANLLEAVRLTIWSEETPIIHICSSSEVYGQVDPKNVPITEDCPFAPASPYGVSKVGEDMLGLQYFLSYGLKTIRSRMFSHEGPRRGDVFALSYWAKQIAAGELGLQPKVIKVGNLKSVRTFMDVRDAVRAYWMMVNQCPAGEVYNIGGNRTMEIGKALKSLLCLTSDKFEIKVDPSLIRPSDVTLQIPCTDKFRKVTGWRTEIPFIKTLRDLLRYWETELTLNPWKAVSVV